ncbi:MAG: hypothetical protein QXJ74_01750 [Nitrososphaera sp.]
MSLPVSILGLLTVMRALELGGVLYFQTIYRITYVQPFHFPLAGSYLADDLLIVAIGICAAAVIFYRTRLFLYAVAGAYGAGIAAALASASQVAGDALAVSILPAIIALYFVFRNKTAGQGLFTTRSLVLSTTLMLLAIEAGALVTWVMYPAFASKIYSTQFWYVADLEAKLFYALGLLSVHTMLLLLFSFGVKPSVTSIRLWWQKRFGSEETGETDELGWILASKKWTLVFLVACSLIVTGLSVYPYLPSINKEFQILSVDATYYTRQIDFARERGVFAEGGILDQQNDRIFSLLVFYALAAAINQPTYQIVAFLPVLLGISMVVSVFFFMRYAAGPKPATLIAPVLTAFSTQFVVGVYAGFFSNMMAIAISFIAMLFYLKYHDTGRWINFGFLALAFSMILLTHIYTWIFMAGTLAVASAISIFTADRERSRHEKIKRHVPLFLLVGSNAMLVLVIALATQVSGAAHLSDILATSIGQDFISARWQNINYTFNVYLGGFLTNTVLIGLALFWTLRANYNSRFNILVMSSIFISSFVFFLGDTVAQSRILLNIPLQIPAAMVVAGILGGTLGGKLDRHTRVLVAFLIIVHLANYAIRALANFYLVPS